MRRWRTTGYQSRRNYPRTTSYPNYYSGYTTAPTYQSHLPFPNENGEIYNSYPNNVNAIQGQLTSLQNSQLSVSGILESFRKEIHQGFTTMSEDLYEIYRHLEPLSPSGNEPMDLYMPQNQKEQYPPVYTTGKNNIIVNSIPPINQNGAQCANPILSQECQIKNIPISQSTIQQSRIQQQEVSSIGAMESELDKLPPPNKFSEVESAIKKHQQRKKLKIVTC